MTCQHAKARVGQTFRPRVTEHLNDYDAFIVHQIGDMVCHPGLNNEACMWDGGDCCWPWHGGHLVWDSNFERGERNVNPCPQDMTHRVLHTTITPGSFPADGGECHMYNRKWCKFSSS